MKRFCRVLILSLFLISITANFAYAEKLKVGMILPLSGPLAEYGIAAQNGVLVAQSKYPNLFNNIEFIYEDSRWDAKLAITAFNKLISKDKVSLVFNWGNPTSEAIATLAERHKIPLLALSLDPNITVNKKYVIRTTNRSAAFSEKLAAYLKHKEYKKLGVVITENTYVMGIFKGLKANLDSDQSIEIIDNYNISNNDFRSSVTKIRSKNYDAIGVFLLSGQVSEFYKHLLKQKVKKPTFGTDFFESTTEIKMARGGMEGAVYTHLGVSKVFKDDYLKHFGNDLQIAYAGNTHDVVLMLGTLFNSKTDLNSAQIIEMLKADKEYQGVCGKFRFKNTIEAGPHLSFPIYTKIIKNGTPEKIDP